MSRWAGVMRDADGLTRLVAMLEGGDAAAVFGAGAGRERRVLGQEAASVPDAWGVDLDLELVEVANLRLVSLLIATGALRRQESRGCHRRRDATGTTTAPWHTLARWDGRELVMSVEEL